MPGAVDLENRHSTFADVDDPSRRWPGGRGRLLGRMAVTRIMSGRRFVARVGPLARSSRIATASNLSPPTNSRFIQLCRSGSDRDRERAAVQLNPTSAGPGDRDVRHPSRHQRVADRCAAVFDAIVLTAARLLRCDRAFIQRCDGTRSGPWPRRTRKARFRSRSSGRRRSTRSQLPVTRDRGEKNPVLAGLVGDRAARIRAPHP